MAELRHPLVRMTGRDPDEEGRASTGLELIFDLTFAIAFGLAGSSASHIIAGGHILTAVTAFVIAVFAVCWSWVNFSWFASAYDTDDWLYRLTTMVQMVGVLVLAMGLPALFSSLEHGHHLDNRTMVFGYVIMRVAMIAQWLRAAHGDPRRRTTCRTYAGLIALVQVGWVLQAIIDMPITLALVLMFTGGASEMLVPVIAERRGRTPWHPEHMAERHSLLAIIALGEVLVGTIPSLSADVADNGWSARAAALGISGTAITFGLWWCYTMLPSAEILSVRRENSYLWGYGHIVLFGSIAGTGAGLHVVAYYLEHQARISGSVAAVAIAVPVALFLVMIMVLYSALLSPDWAYIRRALALMLPLVAAVALPAFGVSVAWSIALVAVVPVAIVTADEAGAGRSRERQLERLS